MFHARGVQGNTTDGVARGRIDRDADVVANGRFAGDIGADPVAQDLVAGHASVRLIPLNALPEITLRAPAAVPPMVFIAQRPPDRRHHRCCGGLSKAETCPCQSEVALDQS